jgi:hypothetical protein
MYTYGGDANLDGKITVDDYGRIDFNVGLGTAGWFNGDFNYDDKITVDDYGIIDFNVGIQGAPFPTSVRRLPASRTRARRPPSPSQPPQRSCSSPRARHASDAGDGADYRSTIRGVGIARRTRDGDAGGFLCSGPRISPPPLAALLSGRILRRTVLNSP